MNRVSYLAAILVNIVFIAWSPAVHFSRGAQPDDGIPALPSTSSTSPARFALDDKSLTEDERHDTRLFYRAPLVAKSIEDHDFKKPSLAWQGQYVRQKFFLSGYTDLYIGKDRYGVLGPVRDAGAFTFSKDVITLRSDMASARNKMPNNKTTVDLCCIAWSGRRYLVAKPELIRFCNSVNAGLEPRTSCGGFSGFAFLKDGDWDKAITGLPAVPASVRKYILPREITARATTVGSFVTDQTIPGIPASISGRSVLLDKGELDGLLPGMALYERIMPYGLAYVKESGNHESRAIIMVGPEDKVGVERLLLSTRLNVGQKTESHTEAAKRK